MILQPMPSRLGWLAHTYLPHTVFRLLLKGMFFTEMLAPWLLLLPLPYDLPTQHATQLAATLFVGLMGGIFLHGSFGHFNLLTVALALPLLLPAAAPPLLSAPAACWASGHGRLCALALALLGPLGMLHLPFTSGLSRSFASFAPIDKWVSPRRRGLMALVRALQVPPAAAIECRA